MTLAVAQHSSMLPASNPFPTNELGLPLSAARAAAQIDQLIRGKPSNSQPMVDAIDGFVKMIGDLDIHQATSQMKSFMDPQSSRIFVNAFKKADLAKNIGSYQELGEVMEDLLQMLNKRKTGLESADLVKLRSFFIYLSDFAAAERRTFLSRPKQPYHR